MGLTGLIQVNSALTMAVRAKSASSFIEVDGLESFVFTVGMFDLKFVVKGRIEYFEDCK